MNKWFSLVGFQLCLYRDAIAWIISIIGMTSSGKRKNTCHDMLAVCSASLIPQSAVHSLGAVLGSDVTKRTASYGLKNWLVPCVYFCLLFIDGSPCQCHLNLTAKEDTPMGNS